MSQNKEAVAQLVSTIENQDKEDILDYQKPLILLNLNRVKTSTNAQEAPEEYSLLCARGVHELDP